MDHRLLTKASAFAVAAAVAASPALAQNDVSTLTDTIVITATKKLNAENVQDVPLAVTGYGEDQLNALKVRDLQDLTYSIPNVQLDDVGTIPGVANFAIRGLGVNSSIPSIDPTVGVFVDGMFLGINAGVVLDQFDIESIEILRGPQGILFGRNVTGGAVVVNTKDAPDEFEGQIRGGVDSGLRGTGNNYYIMGSVGGPIIEDKLNLKVAAYLNDDEGWFENLNNPGENFGERQTFLFRPSILVRPTDNIELNVKYEYGQNRGDGPAAQNHVNNAPGSGMGGPGFDRNTFDFAIDVEGFVDQRWDQVTAELNWDVGFGDGRITNVFSYRDYEASSQSDIDASPVAGFESRAQIDQDQISNELRYAGRFFDRMDLTAGVFFFTQDIGYVEQRIVAGGLIQLGGGGFQDQLTLGVFAQADFELTDTLTINVGGRYNYEEKDVELANIATNGGVGATACSVFLDECSIDFVDGDSWSRFTPKVGLTWAPTETVNVYAHWQQAIRSGGYNLRNTVQPATIAGSDLDLGPGPFDEEIVNAFEIGAKTQPIDGAILNVAAYYNDINNAQRETNFPEAGSLIAQVITNSADITLWGVEVDGQYAVTDNLLLTGFFGYVNGDYDNIFFDISFPVNSTPAASMFPGEINELDFALEVPRLSPFTYGGGFIYSQELGDFGSANFRFNYAFRDQNFFTDNNLGPLNAVDNVDSTLSFTESSGRATLSLYGRNLLNQVNFGGATPVGTGGTFAPLTRGRQVGIELTVNFN